MLEINRRRAGGSNTRLVQSDIFAWKPDRRYDLVFLSFCLSHVPRDRFAEFWSLVGGCVSHGGRVFFIDEYKWDGADGHEESLDHARGAVVRRLGDGREFRMVKVYYDPEVLGPMLRKLGWEATVERVGARIYCGVASRRSGA